MFKVFPCGADKIPLIKGWKEHASNDPSQLAQWQNFFGPKLVYWGVPTGTVNDLLVLDVDVKKTNGFESLKNLAVPDTMTQVTRSGGRHYIFRYPKDGQSYGNRTGFLPGCDVRGEGGYIIWYGAEMTKIVEEAPPWLIKDLVKAPQTFTGTLVKVVPEIAKVTLEEAVNAVRNAPEGESNDTLNKEAFRVGQLIASGSITRDFAELALFEAAKARGKPEREAIATIRSGLDGGFLKPLTCPFSEPVAQIPLPPVPLAQERWTPKPLTKADIMNFSKLRKPQLFRDWSSEDIILTAADGGTGKTTMKIQEAVCLALGEPFLGFANAQRGSTLYITGEDTAEKISAMVGKVCEQMGIAGNEEKMEIIRSSIWVKKDTDLCLIAKDRQGFLTPNTEAMTKVLQAVEDINPKMIVFDPIASFWGSESAVNDMAKAVAKFMQNLAERCNAAIEMINHIGKSSSQSKDMTQFAGRGGTGLPSHSRIVRVLRQLGDDEYRDMTGEELSDGQSAMQCAVVKFSDGSSIYNKPFIIVRTGFLFHRKDLTPAKLREVEKDRTYMDRVFTFVKEIRDSGRYASKNQIVGYFATAQEKLSKDKVTYALNALTITGNGLGEYLKLTESPDATQKDQVYVIIDHEGREF